MNLDIHESWKNVLQNEFQKPYFIELMQFVDQQYEENTCYPLYDNIFQAFKLCSFDDVKVVIIGQDPYPNEGEAHGLCFSVAKEKKIPPSLKNIFKELEEDTGKPYPEHGNLEDWAKQGVLLLNAILTVVAKSTNSHQKKGWERFTDAVIEIISKKKENVVFLLWGGYAKKKGKKVDEEKHLILESGHPSPLSAIRGHWFGNRHFSKTNNYLQKHGKSLIRW